MLARLDALSQRLMLMMETADLEALAEADESFVRQAFEVGQRFERATLSAYIANILARPENLSFFAAHRQELSLLGELDEVELLAFTGIEQGFFYRIGALTGSRNPALLLAYFLQNHWLATVLLLLAVASSGIVIGISVRNRRTRRVVAPPRKGAT